MAGERPIGVTILAILAWLGAVMTLFQSLFLGSLLSQIPGAGGLGAGSMIFSIIIAALMAFVGYGTWKGQNWARIVGLIGSILGMLSSLPMLLILVGIIPLAINGLIFWYLGFNEEAKRYFGAQGFFK